MKICKKCKTSYEDNLNKCPNCGSKKFDNPFGLYEDNAKISLGSVFLGGFKHYILIIIPLIVMCFALVFFINSKSSHDQKKYDKQLYNELLVLNNNYSYLEELYVNKQWNVIDALIATNPNAFYHWEHFYVVSLAMEVEQFKNEIESHNLNLSCGDYDPYLIKDMISVLFENEYYNNFDILSEEDRLIVMEFQQEIIDNFSKVGIDNQKLEETFTKCYVNDYLDTSCICETLGG